MTYRRTNFVDTSQILNNYSAYRADSKSPLILQPNFTQTKIEEIKQPEIFPNYIQRQSKCDNSFAKTIGKVIKDVFGDFLTKFESPLSQLADFISEDVNPSLEKPSGHSIFTALIYLFSVYQLRPELQPDLAISGDGGIYIEYQFDDKFASIQIDSESTEKDRIYVEEGENFDSVKLTEETFKKIFHAKI